MVARPRLGRGPDPAGLLHLAQRAAAARARPGTREPGDANGHARARAPLHGDRDPGEPGRARAPVPVGSGHGRQGRAATALEVARDRQARGAGGPSGDAGAEDALDLVLGLGDVQRGGHRPGQERGGLRLPVGARPEPLQRAGRGRAGLRSVPHGRAADPSRRRPVHAAGRPDPVGRRRPARPGDRRPRHRGQPRARAPRAPAGGQARRPRRARSRARVRRRSLPRQPRRRTSPRCRRSRCRGARRAVSSSTSFGATPCARASRRRRPAGHQIAEFHTTYGGLRARLVETARPVAWLGGRTRGLAIETFAPTRIFSLARRGFVRTIHGRIEVLRSTTPSISARFRSSRPVRRSRLRSTASRASTPTRRGSRRRRHGRWPRRSARATSCRRRPS